VRVAVDGAAGDDAEGAGGDAVGAAVTDVRLDVDVLELVVDERAGGTGLLTRRRDAVLAHVAHHEQAAGIEATRIGPGQLLDKLHVPPGGGRQLPGVVVAVAEPLEPSAGSWFHCLQATSHALQPMQTVVSV
jgi:hypothetical protein